MTNAPLTPAQQNAYLRLLAAIKKDASKTPKTMREERRKETNLRAL